MISLDSRYSFSRTGQPEAQQSTWGETRVRVKRPQSLPRVLITRTSTWIQFGSCFRNKCLWTFCYRFCLRPGVLVAAATAAESLQSCPTLCDPLDGSPTGSPVPGILLARTLEWVAISFSNAWKLKVKGKSLSHVQLLATPWTAAYQAPLSMGFSRQVGCHCLLHIRIYTYTYVHFFETIRRR